MKYQFGRISYILPEEERNTFPDPMWHINEAREMVPNCKFFDEAPDKCITEKGRIILEILREFKSKMTVNMALFVHCREIQMMNKFAPQFADDDESAVVTKSCFLSAMKFLANAGFIKLSSTAEFGKREILLYHASAEPKFRSGKFQL